jgi:thioredoxin-related protein
MDTTVFNRPEIARYLNARFTPVRVNPYRDLPMEVNGSLMSGEEFRRILDVRATPCYYFFSRFGDLAGLFQNRMPPMLFKRMLIYIQDGHFGRTPFADYITLPEASDEAIISRFE